METELRILIADSSAIMRTTIKDALSNYGFSVFYEAENGDEACSKFSSDNPDLVIMDLSLPGKTGMETMRDIRKTDPDANIIICSSQSRREVVIEAVKLGAADFVLKPLKTERLIKAVNKVFDFR